MRAREFSLGSKNLVGKRINEIRKQKGMKQKELSVQLQIEGIDMCASAVSKLEGQVRAVTDIELVALSKILETPIHELFKQD